MSRSRLIAAATAATLGALSLGAASNAEAYKDRYRYWDGPPVVYYGRAYEFYNGYRPYYGPYYRDPYYGRPAGIFRPAGIVYRPFYAEPSPRYCRGWGWVRSRCGKYAAWRCLDW